SYGKQIPLPYPPPPRSDQPLPGLSLLHGEALRGGHHRTGAGENVGTAGDRRPPHDQHKGRRPQSRIRPGVNSRSEAVDKEGSTAFFVEFGIKQFRRKVFYMFRTNPSREFQPETVNIEDLVPQDHLLRK